MAIDNIEIDIIIRMTLHIYMLIPTLGTVRALFFKGKDITLFLKQFEKLCKGHRITIDKGKLEQILNYYILKISNYMENSPSYKKKN